MRDDDAETILDVLDVGPRRAVDIGGGSGERRQGVGGEGAGDVSFATWSRAEARRGGETRGGRADG